jgi:hypothetical protein
MKHICIDILVNNYTKMLNADMHVYTLTKSTAVFSTLSTSYYTVHQDTNWTSSHHDLCCKVIMPILYKYNMY